MEEEEEEEEGGVLRCGGKRWFQHVALRDSATKGD